MEEYFELNDIFLNVGAGITVAECHGFLSGQIAISGQNDASMWEDFLLGGINEETALEQCQAVISHMAANIAEDLLSSDMVFEPLLPDDSNSLFQRTQALSDWCAGFVSGMGTAGLGGDDSAEMEDDCAEFVADVIEISKLDGVEDDEENEEALMELIEYLRAGVIMLHQEYNKDMLGENDDEVLH